jgi:hypothetical protein
LWKDNQIGLSIAQGQTCRRFVPFSLSDESPNFFWSKLVDVFHGRLHRLQGLKKKILRPKDLSLKRAEGSPKVTIPEKLS